jgi:acid stress chaperone HdeB
MKSVGVAVTAIALAISAPAFAAGQTIPLATMTCKQFVDGPKDTIGVILTWMMGYLQDQDEPAELDFSKMEDLGKKLGTYCGQNPTHGVMRALDKVSDADDDSDALKSVVGVWTFGEKQVWIVVRPDGSATQCRVAPDGSVYFSKGAFRAPNILAWEKIWGDDQVVREKDAIKLTGKFGSFSYKRDDGDRPPARCAAP